jgi:aspartokinase/homoserine dehydrogenase 1
MDFTNPVKGISHIDKISLITLEPGMIDWLVLPKTFECCHKKCQCRYLSSLLRTFYLYRNSKFRCRHFQTAINKAFEVEILQNKIKPCIVEKTCAS